MNKSLLKCSYCQAPGNDFWCRICGRDKIIGLKKWQSMILGLLILLFVFSVLFLALPTNTSEDMTTKISLLSTNTSTTEYFDLITQTQNATMTDTAIPLSLSTTTRTPLPTTTATCTASRTSQPTATTLVSCPGTLTSQLSMGVRARVTAGLPNRLRSDPSTSGRLLGRVQPGLVFTIVNGPRCADGYLWWQISFGSITGWTVEVTRSEYWVESVEAELRNYSFPSNRNRPPSNAVLLRNGTGLTDGSSMPPGDFQVEWYCNDFEFGISNNNTQWFCTQSNGSVAFSLDFEDLDRICQATYFEPRAFAIQDGQGSIPAYRWRCYRY